MALSDACFNFLEFLKTAKSTVRRRAAVERLAWEIESYSRPPFSYGDELRTLADACSAYLNGAAGGNDDPLERIKFLADAIRENLDTPPNVRRVLQ